jgi:hypothetical protein
VSTITLPSQPAQTGPSGSKPLRHAGAAWAAIALAALCTTITAAASRNTSVTFDEIVLMAGGARGYETGKFDIAPEHPPLPQYLYGLPIWLSRPAYPQASEAPDWREGIRDFSYRYGYARDFFWNVGNDPERAAFLGRSVGALMAGLLVIAVFAWTRRLYGDGEALLAAGLVAFLPDVLAHGGVAYNDVPLTLAYLLALWSLDSAVRRPSLARGALAGLGVALAAGMKFSAVVLGPFALLLVAAEWLSRRGDAEWRRQMGPAVFAGMLAAYIGLVAIYRGDMTLGEMRYGLNFTFGHVSEGHGAPGYLLGQRSTTGWWYFFPVAFLFKTPAALHLLLLASLVSLARVPASSRFAGFLRSPSRAPAFGLLAFGGALISSSLVIGFRYALPVLPLVCMLVAAGTQRLWAELRPKFRLALGAAMLWYAVSTLSYYPHFLAYISEYGPGRDRGGEVLLDSSLDWGQGLLALRDWMRAHEVESVYLSYFGSAMPSGYGIAYVPMPSFFPLSPLPGAPQPTRYAVVAATNLHGVYMMGDPFERFRALEPDTVLAHTLNVYRIDGGTD